MFRLTYILTILLLTNITVAQEVASLDMDVYKQAKVYAFEENNFEKAINFTREAIVTNPSETDLKIFHTKLHFWNAQYKEAEELARTFLEAYPRNYTGHQLLVDIIESQQQFEKAAELITKALEFFPEDSKLRFRLAYNLLSAEEYDTALPISEKLVEEQPQNQKYVDLHQNIKKKSSKNFIIGEYRRFFLDSREERFDYYAMRYSRTIKKATLLAGFNSVHINGDNARQFTLELYNKLSKTSYSYVYAGYSKSELFPSFRFNAALYKYFPLNIEGSIYVSIINSTQIDTRVLSPSITKTINNSAFTFTANIINTDYSNELTYRARFRQYLGKQNHYVGIAYGSFSRDETLRGDEFQLQAKFISYELQLSPWPRITMGAVYNRNISQQVSTRDQLSLFAKHLF